MTWQCRNVLVSTRFWNRNPPKPVIGPTKYRAKQIYKLDTVQNLLAKLKKCTCFYFGNDMFASKK